MNDSATQTQLKILDCYWRVHFCSNREEFISIFRDPIGI